MMRREDILGTWLLQSYTAESSDGLSHPLGEAAVGTIVYTPDGYMSAQLMRRERPAYDKAVTGGGSPDQLASSAAGYLCYSGPYELDEDADVLRHHVELALVPNWVGGVQVRQARWDGDALVLSADVPSRTTGPSTHVLVWRRPG
jgi:hypothetical protein